MYHPLTWYFEHIVSNITIAGQFKRPLGHVVHKAIIFWQEMFFLWASSKVAPCLPSSFTYHKAPWAALKYSWSLSRRLQACKVPCHTMWPRCRPLSLEQSGAQHLSIHWSLCSSHCGLTMNLKISTGQIFLWEMSWTLPGLEIATEGGREWKRNKEDPEQTG